MHPGYGRTGELRGETSSLHLPPCQGRPEPVAVTEDRLLHVLLFPQLGAPRSWPPNSQELEPFGMKLLLVSQLGLLYVAGVCGCCPPSSSKAERLSPRDPPWRVASRKSVLQTPSPLLMDLLYFIHPAPFPIFISFLQKLKSNVTHTLAARDVPLPRCLPHPYGRRTDG